MAKSKGTIDEADAQKSSGKDRRNLYLAREGEVLPNSPAAEGVSEADMAKRQRCVCSFSLMTFELCLNLRISKGYS